jgi:cell wall-associated NlpC family hydrolase
MSAVERFVACARAQVGKPYKWATAGPNTFDCSGLVAFCYQEATDIGITRSSYDQIHLGMKVPKSGMIAGDLVFWGNVQGDHVGVYDGNGKVYNALNESRGVVHTDLDGNYGMPYLGSRRIFTEGSVITLPIPPPEPPPNPKPGRDRDRQRQRERDRIRRRRRKA